jgi:hypothetical protein
MTITSKPVDTYFDGPFHGLGTAIHLLLSDAGIEHESVNIEGKNWPAKKEEFIASGASLHGVMPILELDGKSYTHQQSILRLLSRRLGKQHCWISYI